jgi:hypothetical protein
MLLLNPQSVTFGAATWDGVTAVSIDRAATRETIEWSDSGPHIVFADCPEQRITIKVIREIARDDLSTPRPGDAAEAIFHTSPTSATAARRRIRADCVITAVTHEISQKKGAIQTITLTAISPDGATDPITTQDASDGG